jgi:hypothetical protein
MKNFTTYEAAEYLGLKESTLRDWRCEKRGPRYVKMGKSRNAAVRYRVRDLDAYQDSNTHTPPTL